MTEPKSKFLRLGDGRQDRKIRRLARGLWDEMARMLAKEGKEPTQVRIGELDQEECWVASVYHRKKKESTDTKTRPPKASEGEPPP